ncbi:hypothetical protein ACLB2K_066375 [Fragaria x ananassa]
MPALTEIFGDDSVLQFGGGTLGHPWGNAPGAVANRVALEACVQARNEGRDLAHEGNEIIREACKWSPEYYDILGKNRYLASEQPGVLQVVPSRTLQLHSGPGIAKLH